ncbi:MAG: hypothetical protein SNJ75_03125 [Gemmataceae bacterium]
MTAFVRFSACTALVALLSMSGQAWGQINPNPIPPVGIQGFGGFGGFAGFGGFGGGVGGPLPAVAPVNPYALSTMPGVNPYLGGTIGMNPYGVGGFGPVAGGFIPGGFPGFGGVFIQDPLNGYLTGVASVTAATGQYWMSVQQARLLREQSRQMSYETARKRVEFEAWYESRKMKTQDLIDNQVRTDLERARKDPPLVEVISGKSLNDLLNNIRKLGRLNRGPNITLEESTLKHINLTSPAISGNVGLLRNEGKFDWPLSLQEKIFDEERERLTRNIQAAVDSIKNSGKAEARLLKDIQADMAALQRKVDDSTDDLTIAQSLEAKGFMRQLQSATRLLRDPSAKKYFNNTWTAQGRTVAELVDFMTREGLIFAPATPGDEAAYMSLYYSVRAFEAGLALASR